MDFQLVLQWATESTTCNYDALIEVEELLIEGLPEGNEVDGHDLGSQQMNIFIRSKDPIACFGHARNILVDHEMWATVRAAYRHVDAEAYTVLWPENLAEFKVS